MNRVLLSAVTLLVLSGPAAAGEPLRAFLWAAPEAGAQAPSPGRAGISADRLLVTGSVGAGILTAYLIYGFDKWWDDTREPFHYTHEGNLERTSYVGGADKFGHAWACHMFQRGATGLLRWSGVGPLASTLIGAFIVQAVFTFAEWEDAVYDYGWSNGDFLFNLLGSALASTLDLVPWLDDLVDFRLWYRPTPYLYRRHYNAAEDYSGQKYFLVFKGGGVPWFRDTGLAYLELYVGFHAPDYRRYRERRERRIFLGLSLDVGRLVAEILYPLLRLPREAEAVADFAFEHIQPPVAHTPLVDASLP